MKTLVTFINFGLLIAFCCFGLWFLGFIRFPPPDPKKIAKTGLPILQAISDYRSDHGLMTETPDELIPDYLPSLPKGDWMWVGGGLSHPSGTPHGYISFSFGANTNTWTISEDSGHERQFIAPCPTNKLPALTVEALFSAKLAEYEKRINRNPGWHGVYYLDKIWFLGLQKRHDLLKTECERDRDIFPDWWLPQMVLAELDANNAQAREQFVVWVNQHRTFFNYWYLARYYRDRGDVTPALAMFDQAAGCSFKVDPDDVYWGKTWEAHCFAFDAAQFCYENKKYGLALKLCRLCEPKDGSWEGDTLLRFVAASELALGQFEPAVSHAQQRVVIAKQQGIYTPTNFLSQHVAWVKNFSELHQAATAHDTNYVFHSWACTEPWSLFAEPQIP